MKKICAGILAAVIILFCFTGCGKDHETTVYSLIGHFENNGISISYENKPLFKGFNAIDGVAFKYEGQLVQIYEFKTNADAKDSDIWKYEENLTQNKYLVLKTTNKKIVELFQSFDAK